ncbi:hypothetical protein [Desulfomonile tiedjei]|uniref:DUF5666 domain-containing protein n=1 Tax=Desulfomonile tiedjei (strain ATCC 49306 / DSM 6799 / DCB-1) TaxID=706587 RepID=I4C0Z2_DESTA|nr:hypothetical protein [Desulfomonile tiedjei]AFM23233.1 hypothetical protein Desti_0500 [Desulfomonile tiedjei DSM 6799]
MKTRIFCCIAVFLLVVALAPSTMAASVSHGKTVNYDEGKKQITIEEYDTKYTKENKYGNSTGKQSTFDLSNALVGITPKPGDVVRIAYEEKDGKKQAIRMMNMTRQDLMKR